MGGDGLRYEEVKWPIYAPLFGCRTSISLQQSVAPSGIYFKRPRSERL